ncbi:MAG TPA: Ig-like domain repeat protein [Xanthobacteraceae bacterium]|nr:Ig-like domain repeat protein [Xanthobacteraceae bacterium]
MLLVSLSGARAQTATTTTVASSQNPSVAGQSVTFTATVSGAGGTPTGNVTFLDGGAPIGSATLGSNGQAQVNIATLAVGNHTITASYPGDGTFAGSTGALTGNPQVVNKNDVTIVVVSSFNPSASTQLVNFTAVLSAVTPTGGGLEPSGTVTFLDGGASIGTGTLGSNGQAVLNTANLALGNHTITASYNGDVNFNGSTGSLLNNPQVVNKATTTITLTSSLNPSVSGQAVTFIATVQPGAVVSAIPSGTITFLDGSTSIGTGTLIASGVNGQATLTTSALAVGSHTIKVSYTGDTNFTGSGPTSLTQTVNQPTQVNTSLTISASPTSSFFGQSVMFTVTISSATGTGTPTGTVTFSDGISTIGSVAPTPGPGTGQSTATFTTTALPVGNLTITANYSGDSTFNPSSISTPYTVQKQGAGTGISSSVGGQSKLGQPVTFTAFVNAAVAGTGPPTGTVTFTVNNVAVATVMLSGGQATFTTSTLPLGSNTVTATYNGDNNFAGGSSGTLTVVVTLIAPTTTTLTSSQNPSFVGQPVTFTATVSSSSSGTPTGSISFTDQSTGQLLGNVPLSGNQAVLTTAALAAGTHNILASYSGDVNFLSSSATLSQAVNKGTTTTTLTASPNPSTPGQAVTFTATVNIATGLGTLSGAVTFKDGGTAIGSGNLGAGGIATFTTSTLSSGSHSITAVFGGNATFAGSTSAPLNQQVGSSADSAKLRELQISATPIIAQGWAQAVSAAMDDAVSAGFGGNPQSLSPTGTGFTYYFNDDAPQRSIESDRDSLRRYLASPNGNLVPPNGSANSAANDSTKRVDDDFRALGYTGGMPTKAPPPPSSTPHDWLAWITVRGTDYFRGTFGNDLKGEQIDAFAGLTRRISPNFVIGAFGGYEHFDYSSQAFNGVLKGDGWTVGAYLGWKLAPNLRFDAGSAWSDLLANGVSGSASGHFLGTRWLVNGGLTGTYPWRQFVVEPSARVFALWEHENAYTDSLGTFQPARNFETGRASAGVKAIYPFAWTSSTVALSPYAGLYADYYFSKDDAQTAGLTTVPLLQGFSARVTGGVAASFAGGATLGAGGEFGGIGSANHIWTWTARGRIPF